MKVGFAIVAAVTSLVWARTVQAHGRCIGLQDHYVVSCHGEVCKPLFRAVQVPIAGKWQRVAVHAHCARVTIVEPFPSWAEASILSLVADVSRSRARPTVVSIEYIQPYPRVAGAPEDLSDALSEPQIESHLEAPDVVRSWYEGCGLAERRRVRNELMIDILLYAGAITLLAGSTASLIHALRPRSGRRPSGALLLALGVKVSVVELAFVITLLQGEHPRMPMPLLWSVPAFILVDVTLALAARIRPPNGRRGGARLS